VKALLVAGALLGALIANTGNASETAANRAMIRGCIVAAAKIHRLPPAVLVTLLDVEDGRLGQVSENANGTIDIGPMQVNSVNLPAIAGHWQTTIGDTYEALRDNFCANVEAGAWILRRCLDAADGRFWEGVGDYHSHTPEYRTRYLGQVLQDVLRLRALVAAGAVSPRPPMQHGPASPPAGG
jgi:Transglycosylase SLT domain